MEQAVVIVVFIVLGFCLVVGVVTVMRWPWHRKRPVAGGVERMVYQLGPLTPTQLQAVYFRVLGAIDANGHASWENVQAAVAEARESYPTT